MRAELLRLGCEIEFNTRLTGIKIGNGKIYYTRLSNGPIESLNRKIKDLKRLGRGFRNFEHFRNRFLYATRALPVLNGVSDYNPVSYLENDEF